MRIDVTKEPLDPITAIPSVLSKINTRKGAVFSSGFDYPGRHSRWDIGFVDPALEFTTCARNFTLTALNDQGKALLSLVAPHLRNLSALQTITESPTTFQASIHQPAAHFSEEERCLQPSVFTVLRTLLKALRGECEDLSHLGFYGAFGYDLIHQFEQVRLRHHRPTNQVDCHLFLPLEVVVVDRKKELAHLYRYSFETPLGNTKTFASGGLDYPRQVSTSPANSGNVVCDHAPGEFAKKVASVIEGTRRGDYFEVVLSQTFSAPFQDTPTSLFTRLSELNPSPYMFVMQFGSEQLVGASPEIFVRVSGKRYETCPIAGTIARGESAVEDAEQVRSLLGSLKDESELTMCTDVDRNDMARVCVPGSVRIIGRRQLEFYSHLIHTVDHLEGTLREEYDALDAFQTHMWACTVTGAPKLAAVQTIEDLENSPRGWYSGAIGFLTLHGDLNTGITLRTAVLKDGFATLRSGATLLYGSDPVLEEEETRTKAAAFLHAVASKQKSPVVQLNTDPTIFSAGKGKTVLLVDYQDSFVHNLASYLRVTGASVVTHRAGFPEELLEKLRPSFILLSPGPGRPRDFFMLELLDKIVKRNIPCLGVCLGHQGIGEYFGATLSQLPLPYHGKSSLIDHTDTGIFAHLPQKFPAGRYHSLYLEEKTIPDCLRITAKSVAAENESGVMSGVMPVIMGLQHKTLPIAGIQFHPESIMTAKQNAGMILLNNALQELCR